MQDIRVEEISSVYDHYLTQEEIDAYLAQYTTAEQAFIRVQLGDERYRKGSVLFHYRIANALKLLDIIEGRQLRKLRPFPVIK